jgi:hypothetical protein
VEIRVQSVHQIRKEIRVRFTCAFGQGEARWTGRTPTPDQSYTVDIDIPTTLRWGVSIRPTLESSPVIATTVEGNRLVAQLQAADPDGDAVLHFGLDTIVADVSGEPPAPGTWVQVRTADLVLYPYEGREPHGLR